MALNKGKAFEEVFKENWKKCFPNTFIFRLHDLTTGYKVTSAQPCDYLAFNNKRLFMLECKSHEGKSIPFGAIPQYERLLQYKDLEDVYPYIIIWFIDCDTVWAVPIKEAEKMVLAGEKSIGIRMLNQKDKDGNLLYSVIVVPSEKKRVFLDSDYTILLQAENK